MNKGFTLVELLGVIIVLTVISLITIPLIDNTLKDSKEKVYNTQINNIALAAKNWAIDYMDELGEIMDDDGEKSVAINLGQLKIESYIDQNIKNPKTNVKFSDNLMIQINYINKDFTVVVLDNADVTDINNIYSANAPYIVLVGNAYSTVELNSTYQDPGCLYFSHTEEEVTPVLTTYSVNNIAEGGVTTSIRGEHTAICSGTYDGSQISIARKVTVE